MDACPPRIAIIVPTRNRAKVLTELLRSISELHELDRIRPEVVVVDNNSNDDTPPCVRSIANGFPTPLRIEKVTRPGKSAAINDAVRAVTSDLVAFLDDDVVVDQNWLNGVESFCREGKYPVGQGRIRLPAAESADPEILKLVERYRTIPQLEHDADTESVQSLNGANFFMHREIFDRVGGLDERLGPGASGTSEDVDLARRLLRAGIAIGYAPQALVYHRIDRNRLTEEYFKQAHRRQGASRFLLRKRTGAEIFFNLAHAAGSYAFFTLTGHERKRYRSKGRIYHYLGMIEAKHAQTRDFLAPSAQRSPS
jgi:GT2 family glycosyltransferase